MSTTITTQVDFDALLFDYVRRIRAEAINLLKQADEIIATLSNVNLADDVVKMQTQQAWIIGNKIISEHGPQVKQTIEDINSLLTQNPGFDVQNGEDLNTDITTIHDAWDRALWTWPDEAQMSSLSKQDLLFRLGEVVDSIYNLIVMAQILTFPDLVNQKLAEMHTGEKLDFFKEFSDEFYKPEFLPVAWQYLCEHPHRINGFLADGGIIYRAGRPAFRFVSSISVFLCVAAGFLLIWLAEMLHYFNIPAQDILFRSYLAIIAGGLVHAFIDIWKLSKTQPDDANKILGNLVLWVHVKQVNIISSIMLLWAGFIILIVVQQITDPSVAFFAGYSIDSVLDVFLGRFVDAASRNITQIGAANLPKSTRQQVADALAQSPKSEVAASK